MKNINDLTETRVEVQYKLEPCLCVTTRLVVTDKRIISLQQLNSIKDREAAVRYATAANENAIWRELYGEIQEQVRILSKQAYGTSLYPKIIELRDRINDSGKEKGESYD